MAYTKTNLNETTKTVAEQAARAYSKTVWNESTPITADKLNKIENGIASALPLTGGTLSGNVVLNNNIAIGGKDTSGTTKWLAWVDKANNAQFGDISVKSVINSSVNPEVNISGKGLCTLYHTGNKPTASDIGAFSSSGGTLTGNLVVQGTTQLNGHTSTGNMNIYGGLGVRDGMEIGGKLAFSSTGTGGGLNANVHNLALHANTGNGQMITAAIDTVYVGNPQTGLILESSIVPSVNIGGNIHQLIHTGSLTQKMTFGKYSSKNWADAQIEINAGTSAGGVARLNFHRESHSQMSILHKEKDKLHVEYDNGTQQKILTEADSCSRFSWNGSRISIDNGGNNASVGFADISEIARHLHNHHTGQNFAFRAAAGLAPVDGWLTMTW